MGVGECVMFLMQVSMKNQQISVLISGLAFSNHQRSNTNLVEINLEAFSRPEHIQ